MKLMCALGVLLCAATLHAGDYVKKDPDQLAKENLKAAKQMFEEAKSLREQSSRFPENDAKVLQEFADLTFEEAQWMQKSGEAYEKNQIRLGERHAEKARGYCDKRGKLSEKIGKIFENDPAAKKEHVAKEHSSGEPSKADKIVELEKKQAELEAEKKRLLAEESKN